MIAELKTGLAQLADGAFNTLRGSRMGATVVTDGHSRYYEEASRGVVFSLTLTATTTGIAAGNLFGAAAAAVTQFALLNPANSGKNLVLQKLGIGIISGTAGAGPLFHGFISGASSISVATTGGTIRSNILSGGASSVAIPYSLAAGSALTGGLAPVTHRIAAFSSTGTAQATVGLVNAVEEIAGDIIVPPNTAWLPLWSAAGTTLLNAYSVTWSEVPV